jgi:hypothetical protein
VKYSTAEMKVASRFFMRCRTSGGRLMPFQAYIVDWTTRKTASPHEKDMMMNIGASRAEP